MLYAVGYWIGTLKKPGIIPGRKKRSAMEDHKIKLYETQLRRLFKAAEQDEQDTPNPVPVHREKIRVIRRRKGGPDQYITESSRQYALAAADMG